MTRSGFTVVELIITITIMGILLTLAVVNLTASQANGRDAERKGDVEALALNIENYYNNQDPDLFMSGGTYLGSSYLNDAEVKQFLPDLDPKSTHAPGADVTGPITVSAAQNNTTNPASIQPTPSKTNDIYVYQPLTASGGLCADPFIDGECRKFNIYYYQEVSGTVEVVTSKRQ